MSPSLVRSGESGQPMVIDLRETVEVLSSPAQRLLKTAVELNERVDSLKSSLKFIGIERDPVIEAAIKNLENKIVNIQCVLSESYLLKRHKS